MQLDHILYESLLSINVNYRHSPYEITAQIYDPNGFNFHAHAPTISLASSFSPSRARRGIRETPQTLVKRPLGMDEWDGQSTILFITNFQCKVSQSHSNDQMINIVISKYAKLASWKAPSNISPSCMVVGVHEFLGNARYLHNQIKSSFTKPETRANKQSIKNEKVFTVFTFRITILQNKILASCSATARPYFQIPNEAAAGRIS